MEIRLTDASPIQDFRLPEYTEIPDVGLYLKQVVKFINDSAGCHFGFTVTDSMLSNYVKMHIVPSPQKKLYYRDHIALLLFISMAKSVLSLENIDALLKFQKDYCSVMEAYATFKETFESSLQAVYSGDTLPAAPADTSEEKQLLGKIVIAMSYKFYLDSCFG